MNTYKKNLLLALALGGNTLLSAGTFISYDNLKSLAIKTQYAMSQGLAGMMVWQASGEYFDGKQTPVLSTTIIQNLKGNSPKYSNGEFTIYFANFAPIEIEGTDKNSFEQIVKTCDDNNINITVIYAFAKPDNTPADDTPNTNPNFGNGIVSLTNANDDTYLAALKRLKDTYNKKHAGRVTILPSLGGWGYKERFEKVAEKGNLELLADNTIKLITTHDVFDGIDIDWEFEYGASKQNYANFMGILANKINALNKSRKKYLLTTALQVGDTVYNNQINNEKKQPVDLLTFIASKVDRVYMMAYDYNGGWSAVTSHNAPLPDIKTSIDGFLKRVPAKKLHLGAAYYGHSFSNVVNNNNGLNQKFDTTGSSASSLGVADPVLYCDLIGKAIKSESIGNPQGDIGMNGFKYHWDGTCQVPYLFKPDSRRAALNPRPAAQEGQKIASTKSAKKKPLAHATKSKKQHRKSHA